MIKQYQFHSAHLGSSVTVSYQDGQLKTIEVENPNFETKQKAELKYSMYYCETDFLKVAVSSKIKLIEIKREVTFDMFWDRYDYKSSGKKEAMDAWKKLSKNDQISAFDYIGVYESNLKLNPVSKLHGSTYLNKKRWIK